MHHAMSHAMSGDVWRYGTQGLDCSEDQGTWDYVKYLDEVSATASGYLRISQDISGSAWSALIFLGTILDMELHLNSSISCHPFVSSPVSSPVSSAVSRRWILCPARGGKCCTISTSLGDLRDLLASSSHKTWRNVPQAPWPPWWWRDMSGIRCVNFEENKISWTHCLAMANMAMAKTDYTLWSHQARRFVCTFCYSSIWQNGCSFSPRYNRKGAVTARWDAISTSPATISNISSRNSSVAMPWHSYAQFN